MSALIARTASSASVAARPQRQAVKVTALKPSVRPAPAVSTSSDNQFMIWQTQNNKCVGGRPYPDGLVCSAHLRPSCLVRRQFETFSYLPPLTSAQIAKQVSWAAMP
jgi:hypothetical protein